MSTPPLKSSHGNSEQGRFTSEQEPGNEGHPIESLWGQICSSIVGRAFHEFVQFERVTIRAECSPFQNVTFFSVADGCLKPPRELVRDPDRQESGTLALKIKQSRGLSTWHD